MVSHESSTSIVRGGDRSYVRGGGRGTKYTFQRLGILRDGERGIKR
jgi:hypothetical protein